MKTLILEGDYTAIAVIILGIMFGPPILFFIIGLSYRHKRPKTAKVFYIIATIYLLISLGICGSMMI